MKNTYLIFTLLTTFFIGLLWLIIVPLWHTPDEQSHFAEVAFLAEKGRLPQNKELDLTEEIYISEKLLGTDRDKSGNNKFTFHPQYRIEYTNSYIGNYEQDITKLKETNAKKNFVYQEAARYPTLYYIPAVIIYKFFYNSDLFVRVYSIRSWSLLLFILNIYFSYKIGNILFPKKEIFSIVLSLLVGFQPMMVFSNIGVNSDALGNLLFTIFLYFNIKIIKKGIHAKNFILLLIITYLSINTKPQFVVMLPLLLLTLFFVFLRDTQKNNKFQILIYLILISLTVFFLLNYFRFGPILLIINIFSKFDINSFIKYSWEYTLSHTISEVLPWYWGIYNWLGVTYPRYIHRIINRILLLSIFGFFIKIMQVIKNNEWRNINFQIIVYLIFTNALFFLALSIYDWFSWSISSFQLGIQGRYYFPLISSQMVLLLVGWDSLWRWIPKIKSIHLLILGVLMILLNLYALQTVIKTYYDTNNILIFLKQLSQYKPWFFKGPVILLIFAFYLTAQALFLKKVINPVIKKDN